MSTIEEEYFTIGQRFREERERLKYTQGALATRICMSDRTVKNYESGASSPKANELQRFGLVGADVLYIVCGQRSEPLSVQEVSPAYRPAEQLAELIRSLKLSEPDAAMIAGFAKRLANP